jgi:hypothetical protein
MGWRFRLGITASWSALIRGAAAERVSLCRPANNREMVGW